MSPQPTHLNGIWRGYLSGSNRGRIAVRLHQCGNDLKGNAVFLDYQFGPVIVPVQGSLDGGDAKFRLLAFYGFAPVLPLDGQFALKFDAHLRAAEGVWSTDIGTGGICKIERSSETALRWYYRLSLIKLAWFARRWRTTVYGVILLAVAAMALIQWVQLSALILILLLLPAPFLFSHHLARLVGVFHGSRIRKIGPVEFDQNPPTAEIATMMQQHAEEAVAFFAVNKFFVFRTKLLVIVISQQGSLDSAQFNLLATHIGIQPDNIQPTLDAIVQANCVTVTAGRIAITEFGRGYVARGIRLIV